MKSVIQNLSTTDFARIRVGIGRPELDVSLMEYVLGPIDEQDKKLLNDGVSKATSAVEEILKNGIDVAMNKFN